MLQSVGGLFSTREPHSNNSITQETVHEVMNNNLRREMADSLMFESKKKSQKPVLDKQRVAKIFRMIEEKFKDDKKYHKD